MRLARILALLPFLLVRFEAAKHFVEEDQSFIDLFDEVLALYETKVLHYTSREDYGIHHLPVEDNPNRFYRLQHNDSVASSTAHGPALDYGAICLAQESSVSTQMLGSDHWSPSLKGRPILVVNPCLSSDSLGNFLSCYFENIMCAQTVGVDYMGIGQVYDPSHFVPYSFFDQLPVMMKHHHPSTASVLELKEKMKRTCTCPGVCHERPYALWTKGVALIRPLLDGALRSYLRHALPADHNYTLVQAGDLSSEASSGMGPAAGAGGVVAGALPLIPDAAIHFRCSDNFVGHYGFLPFKAFSTLIPRNSTTIYVLAERRDRKNVHKRYLPPKCDAIFAALFRFLRESFPEARVLIKRGGDLYLDMARLAYARVTVCSISTYCLWPAIVAGRSAHFPRTALVVGGDTNVDLGFRWLLNPSALLARNFEHADANKIVQALLA